ncbi:hypothetical protein P8V03_09085 [Clostridium sp. A1-XYC3]|uniref:Exo-alpha-sialidase n=1 Tax=Clostridium tanneri TaxID=3037988 RepID=A0ABU4JT21_9CLOT|nr:hypothetical protein [Clostridium sp. A1-XYC3]MDW8801307.1 hypothetical protein [Clostridium sp. A1-XYC3]
MPDNIVPKKLAIELLSKLEPETSLAFKKGALIPKITKDIVPTGDVCPNCGNGNSGPGSPGERQVNASSIDANEYPNITQSETSLAYFGEFILFGFNDSNDAPTGFSGYGFSSDSGVTWCDCGSVPIGGDIIDNGGDPVIAIDNQGIFYYGHLGTLSSGESVIIVNTAQVNNTNRTLQFNNPIVVGRGQSLPNRLQDKEWITVGIDKNQTDSQALYITWSDFLQQGSQELTTIRFSKFTTGATPTEIIGSKTIAHTTLNPLTTYVSGSFPVIDHSGNIYVFYEQIDLNSLDGFIYMVKSTDGGVNFSSPMLVSGPFVQAGNAVACNTLVIAVPPDFNRSIRINEFPHAAVAPDGTLYAVWNASVSLEEFQSNIFLAYSTNGGNSWTTTPVTNSISTEFFPSVAFNCGRAHIHYNRFNDPNNVGDTGNDTFALFKKSFSITEGLSAESQVSTVFSPVPITNPNFDTAVSGCYMGDYNQIIAGPRNTLYHGWSDNRFVLNGNQNPDVFFIQTECIPAPTTTAPTTTAPTTAAPTTTAPTTTAPTTAAPTTTAPTTAAPTTAAPSTAAPTPTPCPCCFVDEKAVVYARCELEKSETFDNITLNCTGRFLDVNVTLRNLCPNKQVSIGVLVYDDQKRLISIKVCRLFTGDGPNCIPSLNSGKFCFVFDDDPCPPARTLTVRVVANYLEG